MAEDLCELKLWWKHFQTSNITKLQLTLKIKWMRLIHIKAMNFCSEKIN